MFGTGHRVRSGHCFVPVELMRPTPSNVGRNTLGRQYETMMCSIWHVEAGYPVSNASSASAERHGSINDVHIASLSHRPLECTVKVLYLCPWYTTSRPIPRHLAVILVGLWVCDNTLAHDQNKVGIGPKTCLTAANDPPLDSEVEDAPSAERLPSTPPSK